MPPKKKTEAAPTESHDQIAKQESESALEVLATVKGFKVHTRDDLELAAEVLADVKGRAKRIEAREKEITAPLNAALKSARALFRPAREALAEIEALIKSQIGAFTADEERRNREALAAAAAAHAQGDARGTQEALGMVATTKNVSGLTTYQKWDFEIVDERALPREFLTANVTLIKEHASHATGGAEPTPIAGVRFFPRMVVASRAS